MASGSQGINFKFPKTTSSGKFESVTKTIASLKKRLAEIENATVFERLGVGRMATDSEIKKSYHKFAKQFHPDRIPDHLRSNDEVKQLMAKIFNKIVEAKDKLLKLGTLENRSQFFDRLQVNRDASANFSRMDAHTQSNMQYSQYFNFDIFVREMQHIFGSINRQGMSMEDFEKNLSCTDSSGSLFGNYSTFGNGYSPFQTTSSQSTVKPTTSLSDSIVIPVLKENVALIRNTNKKLLDNIKTGLSMMNERVNQTVRIIVSHFNNNVRQHVQQLDLASSEKEAVLKFQELLKSANELQSVLCKIEGKLISLLKLMANNKDTGALQDQYADALTVKYLAKDI